MFTDSRTKAGMRCCGTTESGKRCKLKRKYSDFCYFHTAPENENCSICFDNIKIKTDLECGHNFCTVCILKWMSKSMSCPLCRTTITDSRLIWKAIHYGLRNKLLVRLEENYINLSQLSEEEHELLGFIGISSLQFMGEEEWNSIKTHIDSAILDKIIIRRRNSIMTINEPEEWEYFKNFKKIYLFE